MKHYYSTIVILGLFLFFQTHSNAIAQSKEPIKSYYVTVEAHGLMCPFLSPLFINEISKWQPLECKRIENEYAILIQLSPNDNHTKEDIVNLLIQIGYESSKIQITELK